MLKNKSLEQILNHIFQFFLHYSFLYVTQMQWVKSVFFELVFSNICSIKCGKISLSGEARVISVTMMHTESKNVLYRCVCAQSLWLLAALWTVAFQAPPSIEFSRQKYWGGLPFPSPGIFPTQRSNPCLLHLQVDYFTAEPPGKPCFIDKQWQKKRMGDTNNQTSHSLQLKLRVILIFGNF